MNDDTESMSSDGDGTPTQLQQQLLLGGHADNAVGVAPNHTQPSEPVATEVDVHDIFDSQEIDSCDGDSQTRVLSSQELMPPPSATASGRPLMDPQTRTTITMPAPAKQTVTPESSPVQLSHILPNAPLSDRPSTTRHFGTSQKGDTSQRPGSLGAVSYTHLTLPTKRIV